MTSNDQADWKEWLAALLFEQPEYVNGFSVAGRGLVFIVILVWGMCFIFHPVSSNYAGESFLHNANLIFHEAGHVIFSLLGDFMRVLGGTLAQILMPLIACLTLLLKTRDTFGAAVGLWWTGENFIDIAPYVADARAGKLILLGGFTGDEVGDAHDWWNLLGRLNLMQYDTTLAWCSHIFGSLLMLLALAWAGYMLYKQAMSLRES
jgi:hypothetical protein